MATHVADAKSHSARGQRVVERLWSGEAGWWGRWLDVALLPLELTYRAAAGAHHAAYSAGWRSAHRLPVPVVSVGNLAVGGTGKTPFTRWLVTELQQRGRRPAVLHGGYAEDEPELHRAWYPEVPVIGERDRVSGGLQAVEAGADVLVLDDGFQHRRLARDLDIVLVAAENWSERPKLLPRGPWRESPEALSRAQAVVVTRKMATFEHAEEVLTALRRRVPEAVAAQVHLRPAGWRVYGVRTGTVESRHGALEGVRPGAEAGEIPGSARVAGRGIDSGPGPVVESGPPGEAVAVAGVARPDAFLANAEGAGARIGAVLTFRDHHPYDERDLRRIRDVSAGRVIVTTAKDAVKLAPLAPDLELWILEQKVAVEQGADALSRLLDGTVA